ncbi:MAG: WD40/YVTN/BNR-like repeat-containing protein, partial [Candidatus Acidiferrales bacterium]
RVIAVAGVVGESNTYYFGGVGGGVWKTNDAGTNWTPIFDKQPVASVGSIAVAPSDSNVVYVGTGETCIRGNISHGDGVYKSTDAGKTWTNVGLRDTRHIGRVIVHPRNPDIVFVAALGHVYGPNAERGVFRSLDGGRTWDKVLYKDEKTGAIDVTFNPSNTSILFAALWEANRSPYSMTSGGPGSGLYKSNDGGATWKRLEGNGLPKGIMGRIGVSVSGGNPDRVWALIEAKEEEGGLYRSDNGGDNWRRVNEDRTLRQRAWYYTHVIADPQDADTVYVLNVLIQRSVDGGRTFSPVRAPHGDNHGLWIDPTNPQRMINGNDGGATVSVNGGQSWTTLDNQPTAQFYHVTTDNQFPYYVYGAQQDNSTVAIASRSAGGVIDRGDWFDAGGCESGYIAPDPRDPNIIFAGCYEGSITRFDKRTGQQQEVNAWPENPMGHGAADLKHRWQWTAPILFSPHDPTVLYHGGEVLFKTTDEGMSWTAISPDLTRNDKSKQQASGGPITKDNTSVEYYDTIFSVVESPLQKDLIWVGTDDGLVHLTRDAGKTWTNITPKEMPEWSLISLVEASPHDVATAYLAVDRHELDDYHPYIYKTADFGKTWKKITGGLPDSTFVRAVREDPKRKGLLYAGTETGVFVSFDDGANWRPLQLNLPTAPIHDLVVKDSDLVVATHGRSFWILDDLSPVRQMSDSVAKEDAHLFTPALAWRTRAGGGFTVRGPFGQNPPGGALFYYTFKSKPEKEATLEILDDKGKTVRKFTSKEKEDEFARELAAFGVDIPGDKLPTEVGLNRFVWDLRHEAPANVPKAILWGGRPEGPLALPGRYQVKLTLGDTTLTAPLEIKLDPRVKTTQAELEKQFALLMQIRERVDQAHTTVNQIRDLRTQLETLKKRLTQEGTGKAVVDAAEELMKKMAPVEEAIIQVKSKSRQDPLNYPIMLNDKLTSLAGVIESADAAPTKQSYEVYDWLSQKLEAQLSSWKAIREHDLAALNDLIRKENVSPLAVSSGKESE